MAGTARKRLSSRGFTRCQSCYTTIRAERFKDPLAHAGRQAATEKFMKLNKIGNRKKEVDAKRASRRSVVQPAALLWARVAASSRPLELFSPHAPSFHHDELGIVQIIQPAAQPASHPAISLGSHWPTARLAAESSLKRMSRKDVALRRQTNMHLENQIPAAC